MIICNLVAVAIGRFASANLVISSDVQTGKLDLFRNLSLSELLATLSFGHILGVGFVLGLTNIGVI